MEQAKGNDIDNWRFDDKTIMASVLNKEVMANRIFQRKFNVLPGEAGVWINNGRIEKIVTEDQLVASGAVDRIKSKFGAGQDMVLMMIDLSERVLQFTMGIDPDSLNKKDLEFTKKQFKAYGRKKSAKSKELDDSSDSHTVVETPYVHQEEIDAIDEKLEAFKKPGTENKETEPNQAQERKPRSLGRLFSKSKRSKNKKTVAEHVEKYHEYGDERRQIEEAARQRVPILTKDRESIVFQVRVVLSLVPEKGAEIYKLIKGSRFYSETELTDLVAKELEARVFAPEILKYTGADLRGNLNILAHIHKQAEDELFSWLEQYGIQLSRISINPAMTQEERFAMIHREIEAVHKAEEYQFEREKLELQKELDLKLLHEKFSLVKKKAKKENDVELEELADAALLSKKQRQLKQDEIDIEIEKLRKNAEIEAKRIEEELEFLGIERQWALDKEKMQAQLDAELKIKATDTDLEIKKMQALAEEHRKNKQLKTEAQIAVIEAKRQTSSDEQAHIEKLLEIAAGADALDSNSLSEALRQETMRKALDQGERAAQAYSQAESQRFSKEAFTQGIRSAPSIGVASDKGRVFVQQGHLQGPGMQNQLPGTQAFIPQNPVNSQAPAPGNQPAGGTQQPDFIACPHCNTPGPLGSAFCGNCGQKL